MIFEAVPIDDAEGSILGHNVTDSDGRRVLRKGHPLAADDIERLRDLGRRTVFVARLEPGDVRENDAAARLAAAICGAGLRCSAARTGRVNLSATALGLLRIDLDRLDRLHDHDSVTLATSRADTVVPLGKTAATLKILPYALPASTLDAAIATAGADGPLLHLDPLPRRRVGLLLTGSAAARERIEPSFRGALGQRISALGSDLVSVEFIANESPGDALTDALRSHRTAGLDLLVLAGDTAIQDRFDVAPRAIEQAGGEVICFGAPVDPGNLLLLGRLGAIPLLGAPGCARSPKTNIVDLILPRLLAGDRLDRRDVVALAHGGLLDDVPERPYPRSRLD